MNNRRHSPKREAILDVLKAEHGALSASEVHGKLPALDLATIYRNLELFVADGEVQKLQLGGKEALFEFSKEAHHHAVCNECHKVIHFTAPDAKIKALLGIADFNVDEIEVTVRGICNHAT